MTIRNLILGTTLASLVAPAAFAANAATGASVNLDDALAAGSAHGFTHYEEIDLDDRHGFELEGWLDNQWRTKVEFSRDGEARHEKRERRDNGPRGLDAERVREAAEVARGEGLAQIEEMDLHEDHDRIQLEGRDEQGHELEITLQRSDLGVIEVDRD
ncbi:PepSY domain-containing protein [Marinobacter sp. JSM 1782161]|uniref:PepSY domain-containing protein n=1 Tax=Marinobacter sp. JSM 1782161 TaxID=2685906 RepID=UPI001402041D|nr:PepSY domain-containing protein [Marinobacter sp. JSM 1782161]